MDIRVPVLYTSNQIIVDENLRINGQRFNSEPKHGLFDEICENKLSGCTMVFNKKLKEEILTIDEELYSDILQQRLHDTWCLITANILGKIIYDEEGRILYRQHSNNVVGANDNPSLGKKIKYKLNKVFNKNKRNGRSKTASAICDCFPTIYDKKIILLANSNTLIGKINLIKNYKLFKTYYSRIYFVIYVFLGYV